MRTKTKLTPQRLGAITRYIRRGRQIEAIKRLRLWLRLSLLDAVHLMREIQHGVDAPK